VPSEAEALTPTDRYNESLMTGLRTAQGIALTDLENRFGLRPDATEPEAWRRFLNQGILKEVGSSVYRIAEPHWVMADAIAAEFFVA
jgi:oxygen-independent coproporphyrinogen-3 oxidase